jgi:hypothetical protein
MAKRHGLLLFLFCFSIIVGLAAAFPGILGVSFFPYGSLVLLIAAAVLFAAAAAAWLALRRKRHTREPKQSLLYQGTTFGIWFISHNLFWALMGSVLIWGLFTLFGFNPWVLIFSAGALACTCFALTGIFFIRFKKRSMLGLCWQSPIPDGLANFWDHAAATMILRDRYEYAAEYDQEQPTPVLWSISRVFDRSENKSAERRVDLMERDSPKKKLKSEGMHRLKVLPVLFLVTAVLAVLPGLLGLTPPPWDRVPEGWPSAKNPQTTTGKQNQNQEQKQEGKKKGKQEGKSNQGQGQNQDQGQKQEGKEKGKQEGKSDQGQNQQGQGQEQKQEGKEKGKQEGKSDRGQGQEQKQEGKEEGKQKGKSDQGQGQEQKQEGKGEGKQEGKSGESRKDQKETGESGEKQQQKGSTGKGESGKTEAGKSGDQEGSGSDRESGSKEGGDREQEGSRTPGEGGTKQGLGDPNHVPETLPEPEPIPEFPSRDTEMVTLDLPTLTPTAGKGEPPKEKGEPGTEQKKQPAPTTGFKEGRQDPRISKPDQFLPNWIRMLMKTTKDNKSKK